MRFCFGIIALWFVLGSCSSSENRGDTTVPPSDVVQSTASDTNRFALVRAKIQMSVGPLTIPGWIAFDSIQNPKVPVTAADAALLFPKDFGIPSEVSVFAFAKQEIDSVTDGIWFYMELNSDDGPPNKDMWLVLYNKNSVPTAAHCFATSGVGFAYAKMDSASSFREILIEEMEKINVTTSTVTIVKGAFVKDNETHKTFGSDRASYDASRKYVDDFFK
ncbi:MAG TPA: hypothetical protein VK826_04240 [Bacteroidia bacterium]|nr:hypothetical protein [Bacteroidia bacterium]